MAPYGQSDIPKLESIFEKRHLQRRRIFLDTQCKLVYFLYGTIFTLSILDRMPIPIGDFISKSVYDGQLKSQHNISNTNSCRFIDVKDGVEKSSGRSWQV